MNYYTALKNLELSHPSVFDRVSEDDFEIIATHFFEAGEESQLAEIGAPQIRDAAVIIAQEMEKHE